ncbi:MAG: hypothetical protein ACRDOP_04300 [Gaiellaceae bacterium]
MSVRRLSAGTELLAWFAFLGGAAAWTFHLVVGYGLEEIACSPGTSGDDVGGVSVELLIAVLTGVAGAVALASALAGLALRRSVSLGRRGDPRGRLEFMAAAGALAGFVFLLIILLGGIQIIGLESCVPS